MTEPTNELDGRLLDLGRRITRLLVADARTFFAQTVRERFVEAPELADRLEDADLARLKEATQEAAEQAAATMERRLSADTAWLSATAPESAHAPLTAHAPIADAIDGLERDLAAFLDAQGLPTDPPAGYRLPMRFIDGENLATLTMNFWKTVNRRADQRSRSEQQQDRETRSARLRRWEDA